LLDIINNSKDGRAVDIAERFYNELNFDIQTTKKGREQDNALIREIYGDVYELSPSKETIKGKNYVDFPKSNGYKGIHFKVHDNKFNVTELQLKTNLQQYKNTRKSSSHDIYSKNKKSLKSILSRYEDIYAPRGIIRDIKNRIVAENLPAYALAIIREDCRTSNRCEASIKRISVLLDKDFNMLKENFDKGKKRIKPFDPLVLVRDLDFKDI